jgi:hypothetical protein
LANRNQLFLTQRLPALASRDFMLFLIGQLISVTGTWMQATALPILPIAFRVARWTSA